MPVRIHEIAKKLGISSKELLAKAKELGYDYRNANQSIDKITAEYLEQEISKTLGVSSKEHADRANTIIPPPIQSPEVAVEEEFPSKETSYSETKAVMVPSDMAQRQELSVDEKLPQELDSSSENLAPSNVLQIPMDHIKPEQGTSVESQAPLIQETHEEKELQDETLESEEETVEEQQEEEEEEIEIEGDEKKEALSLPSEGSGIVKTGRIDISKYVKASPAKDRIKEKRRKKEKFKPKHKPTHPSKATPPKIGPEKDKEKFEPKSRPKVQIAKKPSLPPMPPLETLTEGEVVMRPPITVRELAQALGKKPFQIIADLMDWGFFITVDQPIEDPEVARRLCAKYKKRFRLERRGDKSIAAAAYRKPLILDEEDRLEDLKPRPPVVTIMGHVDHGKTTLLDAIRKSNIAATEAGQITQHIGAYTISVPHPDKKNQTAQITFIDTPGHEAFSAMRARGANVTDIVILVVAADDGVMPQTIEAIQHARAANVPIIVAVNKIDSPNANPMKVRQQLQQYGLVPEEWGGDTIFVDISALKKQNIDKLLEMILLQAELLELRANPNRKAKGNIIEASISKAGPVATLLVRTGTLRIGDPIVCGKYYGKVRAMIDDWGNRVKEASPAMAVQVIGLNGVPEPGTEFVVVKDEATAREIAEKRIEEEEKRKAQTAVKRPQRFEELLQVVEEEARKELNLLIKGDTQGTAEAIANSIRKIPTDDVRIDIVSIGIGNITENDVLLAAASKAVIVGFNVKVDSAAVTLAKREGVQIKIYSIIYHLLDEVKEALHRLTAPSYQELIHGEAQVRKVFHLTSAGTVAGCAVVSGKILRNGKIRVLRDGQVIFDGGISSLKHLKEDVSEVHVGMECGIKLEGFSEFEEGDVLQCYTIEKVQKGL